MIDNLIEGEKGGKEHVSFLKEGGGKGREGTLNKSLLLGEGGSLGGEKRG